MNSNFPEISKILSAVARGSLDNVLKGAKNPAAFQRHPEAVRLLEEKTKEVLSEPITPLPWTRFRLFEDNGNRSEYENPKNRRRLRLICLQNLILASENPDKSLDDELNDLLWATCDEFTWVLPAHIWTNTGRPADIQLDLGSCNTAFLIAEALFLLKDHIDPRVAERCRNELRRRILDSFLGPYKRDWWERGENNWGAVCAGYLGIVFLYEEKNLEKLNTALPRLIKTLDNYLYSFPEDGSCIEGAAYWEYGLSHFAIFADFLREYTNGEINLFANPSLKKIGLFYQRVLLTDTRTASFSDCKRFRLNSFGFMSKLAEQIDGVARPSGRLRQDPMTHPSPIFSIRDFLWTDPNQEATPLEDAVEYFPNTQMLVVRKSPFAFGAIFGTNHAPHNHNDIGSFILINNNDEGPMDLGQGNYNKQNFNHERYTILNNGSQGHSVPIVDGNYQKYGAEFVSTDVTLKEEGDTVTYSGDIARAYPTDALTKLLRTFTVQSDKAITEVKDDFVYNGEAKPIVERFVGFAKPEIVKPGLVTFGPFEMTFNPLYPATVKVDSMTHLGGITKEDVYLLDIELPLGEESFTAQFAPKQ
mgnify:FL=1